MTSFLKNLMSNLSLGAANILTEFSTSLKEEDKKETNTPLEEEEKETRQFIETCETCGAAIILCHWENGGIYWRHTGTKTTECEKAALKESSMHKYAKKYLTAYLNKGGKPEFVFSYNECVHKIVTPLPYSVAEYREEVEHFGKNGQRCVFDIAGLDREGKIICAIEIWYKHKADNLIPREDIVWVEVRAAEVLDKLCVDKIETPLSFKDYRVLQACSNSACNSVKIHVEEKCLGSNVSFTPSTSRSTFTPSTFTSSTSITVTSTTTFNPTPTSRSTFTPMTAISSNLYLASTLGYVDLTPPYECEARRIQDAAIKGTYLQSPLWNVTGLERDTSIGTSPINSTWEVFLKEGECLKCQRPAKIAFKKPFCYPCYKDIQNQTEVVTISTKKKTELRQALAWIKDLPGDWRPGAPCFYCKRTYTSKEENAQFKAFWHSGTQQVYTNVWWFGDKKCCCSVCLQERIDALGIRL